MASQNGSVWLALCVVVAGTASAWALAPHDKAVGVHSARLGDQQPGKSNPTQTQSDPTQGNHTLANAGDDAKAARERKEDRQDKLRGDAIAVIFGGITICVLLLQTFFFGLQARRLRETIETMESSGIQQSKDTIESLIIAGRSADAAKRSADFLAFQDAPRIYIKDILSQDSKAVVRTANSGKFTAIIHSIVYGYGVFTDLPAVPMYPYGGPRIVEIPPGGSHDLSGPVSNVSIADHDRMRRGEINHFVWGVIVYGSEIHEFIEQGFCASWGWKGYKPIVKDGYTYKRKHT